MAHPHEQHESWIERLIREAMESGEFDNLAGSGQPLDLGDDAATPPDLRMAYKLLRDNNLAPEWIIIGKELAAARPALLNTLRRAAQRYRRAYGNLAAAKMRWEQAQAEFRGGAERYNRKAQTYNLKAPPGVAHKLLIVVDREIQRALDDAT